MEFPAFILPTLIFSNWNCQTRGHSASATVVSVSYRYVITEETTKVPGISLSPLPTNRHGRAKSMHQTKGFVPYRRVPIEWTPKPERRPLLRTLQAYPTYNQCYDQSQLTTREWYSRFVSSVQVDNSKQPHGIKLSGWSAAPLSRHGTGC